MFCSKCGAKENKEKQKINLRNPRTPIIIAALLVVIVALVLIVDLPSGSRGGASAVGEVGFDTPEEALIFYLEGLRDSNLEQMVSAFALETFVENYSLEALIERVGRYHAFAGKRVPNGNDFMISLNLEHRRGHVMGDISNMYFRLAQVGFDIFTPQEVEDVETFLGELENNLIDTDLESIEVIGFIPPELLSERYYDEVNQENRSYHLTMFGADEIVSRAIVFQMGRHQYVLFADVANYDGQWHLLNLGGNIAGLVGFHHAMAGLLLPEDVERYFDDIDFLDDLIVPID